MLKSSFMCRTYAQTRKGISEDRLVVKKPKITSAGSSTDRPKLQNKSDMSW